MNSLTQQLFMIPSFRNFVLEVEDKNQAISKKDDNVLYQLKVNLIIFYFFANISISACSFP